jgi:tetratricopeptide (TPR) repeat protein
LSGGLQISAGDVSEALRPAFYLLAVAASAWVLASARRHGGFRRYAVWSWAVAAFVFPPIVLPLYLVARMFTRRAEVPPPTPSSKTLPTEDDGAGRVLQDTDESAARDDAGGRAETPAPTAEGSRLFVPLLYAGALLALGAASFYWDYGSFDAHLARAARAKLYGRPERAIGEYRAALRTQEDAHTRKLLGLELLEAGRAAEAVAELRAAEAGGEPDDMLAFHVGSALEASGRAEEAAGSYLKFLQSGLCARTPPGASCEAARARVAQAAEPSAP